MLNDNKYKRHFSGNFQNPLLSLSLFSILYSPSFFWIPPEFQLSSLCFSPCAVRQAMLAIDSFIMTNIGSEEHSVVNIVTHNHTQQTQTYSNEIEYCYVICIKSNTDQTQKQKAKKKNNNICDLLIIRSFDNNHEL